MTAERLPASPSPADVDGHLYFTPVPCQRRTARGWDAEVQIAFIQALSRSGVVVAAARAVVRSARSAYLLRERPGAESFARAWDLAQRFALEDVRAAATIEAIEPETVPIFRQARRVGTMTRYNNKLAMAALRAWNAPFLPPAVRRHETQAWARAWPEPYDLESIENPVVREEVRAASNEIKACLAAEAPPAGEAAEPPAQMPRERPAPRVRLL